MTTQLKIRRFPMDAIKPKRTILIIGRRGAGKSTLLKDILYHIRKRVDTGFAMSPTHDTIRMFEDCLPPSHIYDEYSPEAVTNMLVSMKTLDELGKQKEIGVFLDDCMYDKSIMKSKNMREIHMNGRHLGFWFINSVQYLMDMPCDLRGQIDYVFALKENNISNRRKLHEYFFGVFDKYDDFSLVFDKCTNNYECLVLDNTQLTHDIQASIYYYKANDKIGKFRLGKSIYFKLDHYFRKEKTHQNKNDKTKLPDPIKTKMRITNVEKMD